MNLSTAVSLANIVLVPALITGSFVALAVAAYWEDQGPIEP